MLAENSNYCLKNEPEFREQGPEELAEAQTGVNITQPANTAQDGVYEAGRAASSQGQDFGELKEAEKFSPRTISDKGYLNRQLLEHTQMQEDRTKRVWI